MEFNPIKVINPTQIWELKKIDPRLDPLYEKVIRKIFTSKGWEMAKLWPTMEFNPIKFNNPNGPQKIEILKRLDPLHVKSHQKVSPQKVKKRQGYGL